MNKVRKTEAFVRWLDGLRDGDARERIEVRLARLADGNPGPHRALDGGILELKIDYGPGYRLYFTRIGHARIEMLIGGVKRTQQRDIETARKLRKRAHEHAS